MTLRLACYDNPLHYDSVISVSSQERKQAPDKTSGMNLYGFYLSQPENVISRLKGIAHKTLIQKVVGAQL